MVKIYEICGGVVQQITAGMGGIGAAAVTLPSAMETAIEDVGFWASIPLWLVTILGSLFITVLSFIMIMTVYGRFFKLYMYTALAPVPISSFAGEGTSQMGKSFIKSYVGVCLEGAVGPNIIPFVNRFPTNTQLYMRMTTKPSESKI